MKKFTVLKTLFGLLVTIVLLTSCGNASKGNKGTSVTDKVQKDRVEILYFHGAQRCITCRAIEKYTKELLDSVYSKELASGQVVYKIIDISKKENEAIADKYEVSWSSLFVNGWKGEKESIHNMTEFAFANARNNPAQFQDGIRKKVDELLK